MTRRSHSVGGLFDEVVVDCFAGGGGASLGIERALGRAVDVAVNHDEHAIEMHAANHPLTTHLRADIWSVDPRSATGGRPVGLLWASPDCRHFSRAKGGKPVSRSVRALAWVVVRWARDVRPRIIALENVREFETWGPLVGDRPCPERRGETFAAWVRALEALGYSVERRVLNAADFGAPTNRRRLFIIARCDNEPIVWPEPTHAPRDRAAKLGLKPHRAAAECIDWSLPCHSIFLTPDEARAVGVKRPLADATMRRIAQGIRRYVIDAAEPFVVCPSHQDVYFRGQSLRDPIQTIPSYNQFALVDPFIVGVGGRAGQSNPTPLSAPIGTVTGKNDRALVAAYVQPNMNNNAGTHARDAAPTVTGGGRNMLVAAFLSKYFGGVVGQGFGGGAPAPTVTAIDHNALCVSHLSKFYGTNIGADLREPMPTQTAQSNHIAEVRAFLVKYYGNGAGQPLGEPLGTATVRDRFGLVTIGGVDHVIADIGLRMLTPRELARAQGFPDEYVLTGTKTQQVARIGNSVSPPVAEAIVRANCARRGQECAA